MQVAFDNLVLASVYVPNGGKDYAAKLSFLQRLVAWVRALHADGRELILCGDINIARTDIDVHPQGTQTRHHWPTRRRAHPIRRAARRLLD